MQKVKRLLAAVLPFVLLGVAGFVLHRELSHLPRRAVAAGLASISSGRILLALALTGLNYFVLTLYDVLALGHVRRELPYSRVGFTAFVMKWGREQGFHRFNLGMAPFSGFEQRSLAPMWTRIGTLLFRHGEHFYNFQGLRQYKEKFRPDWAPRYLASPGGLALPGVLLGVASLVSRGLGGVVAR